MATKKIDKKEEFGAQIQLGSIIKTAQKKRQQEEEKREEVVRARVKYYPMPIKVSVSMWNEFTSSYYALIKELGHDYVSISRSEVFVYLVKYMDKKLDMDIKGFEDFYDRYIGVKGKRFRNERSPAPDEKVEVYCWANFTKEELALWKQLLTKLALKTGIERASDFSKQYFMVDIIGFFSEKIDEIAKYIKEEKENGNTK